METIKNGERERLHLSFLFKSLNLRMSTLFLDEVIEVVIEMQDRNRKTFTVELIHTLSHYWVSPVVELRELMHFINPVIICE